MLKCLPHGYFLYMKIYPNVFIGTMIMSLAWNDATNMLAALADGKFTVWYYPSAVYVDKDLLPKTVFEKEAA